MLNATWAVIFTCATALNLASAPDQLLAALSATPSRKSVRALASSSGLCACAAPERRSAIVRGAHVARRQRRRVEAAEDRVVFMFSFLEIRAILSREPSGKTRPEAAQTDQE